MKLRNKVNILVVVLIGFGMPLYYKIRFLILGQMTWSDIFDPIGLIDVSFGLTLATLVILGHDQIVLRLKKLFKSSGDHISRLTWQFIITSIYSMIIAALFTKFFWSVVLKEATSGDFMFDFIVMSLMIPIFVNGITESVYFYGEWEREATVKEQLEKENVIAKYEILKNQISPHFLFNCFNSLAVLIDESKEKALQFLKQLSVSYRYVLESGDKELIVLREELEALEAYVHLMRVRFGDDFEFNFDISDDVKNSNYIVPMSLQLLFENVLKHNVADKNHQLMIDLTINEGLIFKNNITQKTSLTKSTGIGITNLVNRYKMLTSDPVLIHQDDQYFTVRIPQITEP